MHLSGMKGSDDPVDRIKLDVFSGGFCYCLVPEEKEEAGEHESSGYSDILDEEGAEEPEAGIGELGATRRVPRAGE